MKYNQVWEGLKTGRPVGNPLIKSEKKAGKTRIWNIRSRTNSVEKSSSSIMYVFLFNSTKRTWQPKKIWFGIVFIKCSIGWVFPSLPSKASVNETIWNVVFRYLKRLTRNVNNISMCEFGLQYGAWAGEIHYWCSYCPCGHQNHDVD